MESINDAKMFLDGAILDGVMEGRDVMTMSDAMMIAEVGYSILNKSKTKLVLKLTPVERLKYLWGFLRGRVSITNLEVEWK